jgi:hypothetical protein
VWQEGLGKLKKSNDLIGNRTHGLRACNMNIHNSVTVSCECYGTCSDASISHSCGLCVESRTWRFSVYIDERGYFS